MLYELYLLMIVLSLIVSFIYLVDKKMEALLGILSIVLLFSLSIASLGLERKYCGICQSTFTEGNFTVNYTIFDEQENFTYVGSKNVTYHFGSDSTIWEFIYILDVAHDDWNITAFALAPEPCEGVCSTVIESDPIISVVWSGLAFLMLYLVWMRQQSKAMEDPKRIKWPELR